MFTTRVVSKPFSSLESPENLEYVPSLFLCENLWVLSMYMSLEASTILCGVLSGMRPFLGVSTVELIQIISVFILLIKEHKKAGNQSAAEMMLHSSSFPKNV